MNQKRTICAYLISANIALVTVAGKILPVGSEDTSFPSHLDIRDLCAWCNYLQLSCFLCFPKGAKTAILQLPNPVNIFQTEVV